MTFVDRVVNQLELEYVGLGMSAGQRFESFCSRKVFEPQYSSHKNVREWEGRREESSWMYLLQKESQDTGTCSTYGGDQEREAVFVVLQHRVICSGEDCAVRDREQELAGCGGNGGGRKRFT